MCMSTEMLAAQKHWHALHRHFYFIKLKLQAFIVLYSTFSLILTTANGFCELENWCVCSFSEISMLLSYCLRSTQIGSRKMSDHPFSKLCGWYKMKVLREEVLGCGGRLNVFLDCSGFFFMPGGISLNSIEMSFLSSFLFLFHSFVLHTSCFSSSFFFQFSLCLFFLHFYICLSFFCYCTSYILPIISFFVSSSLSFHAESFWCFST